MKYCLPLKNLKYIAKFCIFDNISDKFNTVEICENYGQNLYPKSVIIEPRVSASSIVETETF